jgi:hypothetical protein
MSVIETAGTEDSILQAQERDPNRVIYYAFAPDVRASQQGLFPWKEAIPDQAAIFGYARGGQFLVTDDPNIKTLDDLAGKSISLLEEGDASAMVIVKTLENLGIRDQVRVEHLGWGATAQAFRDGLVDASGMFTSDDPTIKPAPLYANFEEMIIAKRGNVYPVPMHGADGSWEPRCSKLKSLSLVPFLLLPR